jgi:hypothetical protein
MRAILGYVNAGVAGIALLGGSAALIGLPGAVNQINREPEDTMSLILLALLAFIVASAAALNSRLLLAQRHRGAPAEARFAIGLNVVASVLLGLAAVLGFVDGQASSVDLKYLGIPALFLALGTFVLVRGRTASS